MRSVEEKNAYSRDNTSSSQKPPIDQCHSHRIPLPSKATLRNRRLQFLRLHMQIPPTAPPPPLDAGDFSDYFSDGEMRARDPVLFQEYVGRYVPESERTRPFGDEVTLVERILRGVDDQRARDAIAKGEDERREAEEEVEEEEEEEEEDEVEEETRGDDNDDTEKSDSTRFGNSDAESDVTEEQRVLLREELVQLMKERFLTGLDTDFDYTLCDTNSAYNDLDQIQQDAEDAYFDAADPQDDVPADVETLAVADYDY